MIRAFKVFLVLLIYEEIGERNFNNNNSLDLNYKGCFTQYTLEFEGTYVKTIFPHKCDQFWFNPIESSIDRLRLFVNVVVAVHSCTLDPNQSHQTVLRVPSVMQKQRTQTFALMNSIDNSNYIIVLINDKRTLRRFLRNFISSSQDKDLAKKFPSVLIYIIKGILLCMVIAIIAERVIFVKTQKKLTFHKDQAAIKIFSLYLKVSYNY